MGGSKKVTVGYKYHVGMHMAFCHGPVDYLLRLMVDDRTAWSGQAGAGEISINNPGLFGGESREGGVIGDVDVLFGEPAQVQNLYLQSVLGADIPGFRGVVSLVLKQVYLGLNPYLKPWKARFQRIHVRQDGIEQWYDEKAAIPFAVPGDPLAETYDLDLDAVDNSAVSYPGTPTAVRLTGLDPAGIYIVEVRAGGDFLSWSPWDTNVGHPNPWWTGQLAITNVDTGITQEIGGPLRSTEQAAFDAFIPGTISGGATFDFWLRDTPTADNRGGMSIKVTRVEADIFDMNPAHIIRECLTDPDWGMGYQESDINDDAFEVAADRLFAERMGMSLLWDRQIPIEDFIKEVVKHISATLYTDRATGKFVLKLIRDDYVLEDLVELDESSIIRVENPVRPVFGELTNSVTIVYWDSQTGKKASLPIQDPALIAEQGATINTTVQYPGFTNAYVAGIAGARDLRALSGQPLSCTIYANRKAARLNVGDAFKFSWSDLNASSVVMRVAEIALGTSKTNRVRLKVVQDTFATPDTASVSNPNSGGGWTDPASPPTPALYRAAMEAPYYEVVQANGQTDTDSRLTENPDLGLIAVAAVRPGNAINAILAVDSGGGYNDSGALDFCPTATIDESIDEIAETFDILGGIDLDLVELGSFALIDNEIVRVDAVSDTSITVGRGVLDTAPRRHTVGARIFFIDGYLASDEVEYLDAEEIDVKVLPVTGQGSLPEGSATADTITMGKRAIRPYVPGQFKIDGVYYPTAPLPEEVELTWVHRDRTQQTGGTLLDHTDAGVGPEDGVTYRVRVLDPDGVVVIDVGGISGTSYTLSFASMPVPFGKVQVYAERDGLLSFQPAECDVEFELTAHTFVVIGGDYVGIGEDYVVEDDL